MVGQSKSQVANITSIRQGISTAVSYPATTQPRRSPPIICPHTNQKSTIRRIPAAGGVNDVREISTQIQNNTWVLLRVFTVKSLPISLHASLSVFTILEPPLNSQQSRRSDTFSGKLLSSSGKICSRIGVRGKYYRHFRRALGRELNNNIRRVVDLYADLSNSFAKSVEASSEVESGGTTKSDGRGGQKRIRSG
ncbi:hypothetical protein Vadar_017379 [Vaccinium darrowii]|uniref:Uncharacterized protein n=1 Tax=Vaccinium darrowii TaxID=229202 RepID=A0ACB7ZKR2_9ERIC|nr:hypothetical protein Vadar_017379 [Vaccinium darrowii]